MLLHGWRSSGHLLLNDALVADMGLLALMDPVSGVEGCRAAGLRLMSVEAFNPPGGPLAALLLQA